MRMPLLVLVTGILVSTIPGPRALAGSLRAGVAAADITVTFRTRKTHDPLLAKVLVLDDQKTRVVVICLDLQGSYVPLVVNIRACLKEELGIPKTPKGSAR